jgi:hypothetical protein
MYCNIYWTMLGGRFDQALCLNKNIILLASILLGFFFICVKTYEKTAFTLILPKTMKECKLYLSQLFLTISPYCPFNEVVVPRDRCIFDFNL